MFGETSDASSFPLLTSYRTSGYVLPSIIDYRHPAPSNKWRSPKIGYLLGVQVWVPLCKETTK